MKKALLIVEGLKDKEQIFKAVCNYECKKNIGILVTEGTKFNNRIEAELEDYVGSGYEPYILSDPDEGGDALSNMIQHWHPEIPRIQVDDRECAYWTGKKFKSGIEYASYDYLKELIFPLIGQKFERKKYPVNWD